MEHTYDNTYIICKQLINNCYIINATCTTRLEDTQQPELRSYDRDGTRAPVSIARECIACDRPVPECPELLQVSRVGPSH